MAPTPRPPVNAGRSTARLAAVQALYQQSMGQMPVRRLLAEFHAHRLAADPDPDAPALLAADRSFFDALVLGVSATAEQLDAAIARFLAPGWTIARLDRLMLQILRCGAWELQERPDIPGAAIVSEYVDVADAFYPRAEVGFANALLDRMARAHRQGTA